MRLIDVDELKKWFEPYKGLDVPCAEVCQRIDSMPTAYDIEAVVKELEQEKFVSYLKDDVAAMEHNLTLNKAIAIVKRGGRNENTDSDR